MEHEASSGSKPEKLLPMTNVIHQVRNDEPFWYGLSRKQLSLVILTLQNASLGLIMRHSRLPHDNSSREQPLYVPSTAVFLAEVVKFSVCLLAIGHLRRWSLSRFRNTIYKEVIQEPREVLKMAIPSALYAAQNNLLYVALSNLDATTFQITYQLKILTTALFSVLLLRRSLPKHKWVALIFLMMGVALVQLQTSLSATNEGINLTGPRQNPTIGFIAVLTATISSGFSGCYFEMLLKSGGTNMWVRNLQLGLSALAFSAIAMLVRDWSAIRTRGLFAGYDLVVWAVVLNQAIGGLLVAIVVKYADNILKTFSTALAIIVSAVASVYFFDFHPSLSFMLGAAIVMLSTYMFALTGGGWLGIEPHPGQMSKDHLSRPTSHKARLSVPFIPQMRVQPPTPDIKRTHTIAVDAASTSAVSPRTEKIGETKRGIWENGRVHSSPLKSESISDEKILD